MTRLTITSTSNDRLKPVRRLRRRGSPDVFLVEGHRLLRRALEAGAEVLEVYACRQLFLGSADEGLVALAERRGARVVDLGTAAFQSITGPVRPDGLAAVVRRWPTTLAALPQAEVPLLLVAEAVERPGNLGSIVRAAAAAGATGLVVCDGRTDVFHPETVRGSVGTLFDLPVAACPTDLALAWLEERAIDVVVASPDGRRALWDADLTRPLALVVGGERYGVTDRWRAAAAATVRIPMPGPADSLNVAVAAGVAVFEAVRQRTRAGTDAAAT